VLNLIKTKKTNAKQKKIYIFFARSTPLTLSFSAFIRNANEAGEKKEASFFLLWSSLFFCEVVSDVLHS